MDPYAALAEMKRTREAIDRVVPPAVPGIYGWFMRRAGHVGPFPVDPDEPVYIGRSIDLAKRSLRNHFRSGRVGQNIIHANRSVQNGTKHKREVGGVSERRQSWLCGG